MVLFSVVLCIFVINLSLSNYLKKQDKQFTDICKDYNKDAFVNSFSFALSNGYYPSKASIDHCNKEFRYTYHTNDLGLRNSFTGDTNILAIGDSFTFGFGVEDAKTYPALLQAHNAGVWGASFDTQLVLFKRSVELLKPNVVIWGLYPPHIITMMPGGWSKNCPGDTKINIAFPKFTKILVSLWNKSSIGKYFMNRKYINEVKVEDNVLLINKDCYKTKEVLLYDTNMEGSNYTNNSLTNEEFLNDRKEVYTSLREIFKEVGEIAKEKEIKIYFLLIPSKMQLMLEDKSYSGIYNTSSLASNLPFNNFSNILLSSGFSEDNIIDLSESFLDEENKDKWQEYFFIEDAHWNENGHKFVADIIREHIEKFKMEDAKSKENEKNENE